MISFPYILLFFALLSISIAAPLGPHPIRYFGSRALGHVFYYTDSESQHPDLSNLPVIVIKVPETFADSNAEVVEIGIGMKYLGPEDKVLATKYFPKGTELTIEGKVRLLSEENDIWINVRIPRTVRIHDLKMPEHVRTRFTESSYPCAGVFRNQFFHRFGYQLGLKDYPAQALVADGTTGKGKGSGAAA